MSVRQEKVLKISGFYKIIYVFTQAQAGVGVNGIVQPLGLYDRNAWPQPTPVMIENPGNYQFI